MPFIIKPLHTRHTQTIQLRCASNSLTVRDTLNGFRPRRRKVSGPRPMAREGLESAETADGGVKPENDAAEDVQEGRSSPSDEEEALPAELEGLYPPEGPIHGPVDAGFAERVMTLQAKHDLEGKGDAMLKGTLEETSKLRLRKGEAGSEASPADSGSLYELARSSPFIDLQHPIDAYELAKMVFLAPLFLCRVGMGAVEAGARLLEQLACVIRAPPRASPLSPHAILFLRPLTGVHSARAGGVGVSERDRHAPCVAGGGARTLPRPRRAGAALHPPLLPHPAVPLWLLPHPHQGRRKHPKSQGARLEADCVLGKMGETRHSFLVSPLGPCYASLELLVDSLRHCGDPKPSHLGHATHHHSKPGAS